MPERIIVPLDGSTFAEDALATALSLIDDSGTLELVSVNSPQFSMSDAEEEARRWTAEYLEGVTAKLPPRVEAETHVLIGHAAEELLEHIEGSDAELVVIASHGRGPLTRVWLGSVADALVRQAELPVMLVHPNHPDEPSYQASLPLRRILVPIDGSELAEAAVGGAIRTFGRAARLTLVRVVDEPGHTASVYLPDAARENREAEEAAERAEAELAATVAKFSAGAASVDGDVIRSNHVGKAIADYSEDHDFDAIAIASHGRGGVRRIALGSVADKVVRSSKRPVLVLRP